MNKKILIVSRHWPSSENSGVSLTAAMHAEMLVEAGFDVSIMGSSVLINEEKIKVTEKFFVKSSGSGAIYSPSQVDRSELEKIITDKNPDLVIVEGWQTSLTDATIDVSYNFGIPVVVFSHGVSLHPLTLSFYEILKSLAWLVYRYKLAKRLRKLHAITCLNNSLVSNRFYDRFLAHKYRIPVFEIPNTPYHYRLKKRLGFDLRKKQVLVVGYFSAIKNQLAAIKIVKNLPENIVLKFVGPKNGPYFQRCLKQVARLGLSGRVSFFDDTEVNLEEEIASSLIVLMPSKTEVLPLTLLESMASGTPYVSTNVGAIGILKGGVALDSFSDASQEIIKLVSCPVLWEQFSLDGVSCFKKKYSRKTVKDRMVNLIDNCIFENKLN